MLRRPTSESKPSSETNCQCSDPRDKVYALLGFADDCNAENIVVKYSKSVFGVFEDVVKFLLALEINIWT